MNYQIFLSRFEVYAYSPTVTSHW